MELLDLGAPCGGRFNQRQDEHEVGEAGRGARAMIVGQGPQACTGLIEALTQDEFTADPHRQSQDEAFPLPRLAVRQATGHELVDQQQASPELGVHFRFLMKT